jgi:hypothetical protein
LTDVNANQEPSDFFGAPMNLRCFSVLAGIGASSRWLVRSDEYAHCANAAATHNVRVALQSHRFER